MNLIGSSQAKINRESPYIIGSPRVQKQDPRKGLQNGLISPSRQVIIGRSPANFDQQSVITASFGQINVSGESPRNQPLKDSRQGSSKERQIIINYMNQSSLNHSGSNNSVIPNSPPKLMMHRIRNSDNEIPRVLTDSKKGLPPRPPQNSQTRMKQIEQYAARQREMQNTIDNLRQQLERKNNIQKNLQQKPQTLSQPLINQFNEQIQYYKGQSQKLMIQNIKLKKQLVFTKVQSDEKLMKVGSMPSFGNIQQVIFSQSSIRSDFITKQSIIKNLQLVKELITKLNRLKQSQIEMLKNHQNSYDYLIVDAEYQTNYFNLTTEIENIKYQITFDSDRRDTIPKDDKKTMKELKAKITQYSEEISTLKQFIQKESQWKARFLLEFQKQVAISKLTLLENEQLKRTMETQPVDKAQNDQLSQLVRQQHQKMQQLQHQLQHYHSQLSRYQQQSSQRQKYIKQLESSLSQIKPKRPFILNKSAEQRQSQNVMQLTAQNTRLLKKISQLKQQLDHVTRPQQREGVLKQLIQELNVKINQMQIEYTEQSNAKNNTIRLLEEKIVKLQSSHDAHGNTQREQLARYQKEISGILSLANDNQQKIRSQFSREMVETLRRHEADKNEYIGLLKQLADQKAKNQQQFQIRERQLVQQQVNHEKQLSRLNSENAALKKSMEIQIERMTKTNSQHQKTLIQKYEKDILTLNRLNHQLMSDNKGIVALQQQNSSLTGHIRQLQTQIKEKSTVVEHLWEIKKVEYDNIMKQIYRLKVSSL